MKYSALALVLFIFFNESSRSQSLLDAEVSAPETLSKSDSLTLYYGLNYIRSEIDLPPEYQGQLTVIQRMAPGFNKITGSKTMTKGAFTNETKALKDQLYLRFQDKTSLVADLKSCALLLGEMNEKDSYKLAVYLLDLLSKIHPLDPSTAYERERIAFQRGISSNWDDDGRMVNRIEVIGANSEFSDVPGITRRQSVVKGLLVRRLDASQFVGKTSQMNATLIAGNTANSGIVVKYNQRVGKSMAEAVDEMLSFHTNRHTDLPDGVTVELSFAEQYIPKDGPSAGVANALLIESIVKGYEFDSGFAVTGALDSTGMVKPVGGISGKIRGAIDDNCKIVAIPQQNEQAVVDTLILKGISNLANIQIIGIGQFEDALTLAVEKNDRDENIQAALDQFEEVKTAITKGNFGTLANSAIQQKLQKVLTAIPSHYSAKYLLLESVGKRPNKLGLLASVQVIDQSATPLIEILKQEDLGSVDGLKKDRIWESIAMLKRMRPYLDQRTKSCSDAIVDFSTHLRVAFYSPPSSRTSINRLIKDLNSTGRNISKQYESLFARADVKKELYLD